MRCLTFADCSQQFCFLVIFNQRYSYKSFVHFTVKKILESLRQRQILHLTAMKLSLKIVYPLPSGYPFFLLEPSGIPCLAPYHFQRNRFYAVTSSQQFLQKIYFLVKQLSKGLEIAIDMIACVRQLKLSHLQLQFTFSTKLVQK